MATCKDCLHFTRYCGEDPACNDVQERCQYFKNKENFVKVCRCKDCLYFEYKVGSYGICEHWHANSQDIFDLNYCGYAEPRTPKERGGKK